MSSSLIDRVRERLVAETSSRGTLSPGVVAAAIRAESGGLLGDTEVLSNLRLLETELTGAGLLEPLLCAPTTTDVLVTAPDAVWVDDGNGLRRSTVCFTDEDAVRRLAQRLALLAGRRLDEAQPWVDGQLTGIGPFTVRLHAVLPPVASAGTCLSLRVLRPATQNLDSLIRSGAIPPEAADLLRAIIRARLAFLISGGTGCGKTTLLAAALGAVDGCERIVCVEDAAELAPPHPHLVRLVARAANVEGVGEVTVRDLVRQALRMRPDRIVVGEVRGAEVVDLLAALNTGHDGGAGTVHANNPAEVPARLEALGALGGLDRAALISQLAAAVQVLLHVGRDRNGRRRLAEIAVLHRAGRHDLEVMTAWHADDGWGLWRGRSRRVAPAADVVMTVSALALAAALLLWPVTPRRAAVFRRNRGAERRCVRAVPVVAVLGVVVAVLVSFPAALAVTAIATTVALRRRRGSTRRRRQEESAALQAALDVLVGELRTGVHPVNAFDTAAAEASGPVSQGLSAVAARARLGADVAAGLADAAADSRLPMHWHRLAACWRLAHAYGLSIATLMRTAQRDIVERERFSAHVQAAMAGPRATAAVLAGLPVAGLALGQLIGAKPLAFLCGPGIGGWLLVVGVLLACAGLTWSDRITDRVLR